MGQQWTATGAGALGAADSAMAEALLEEVVINPTIEPPELGKQTLGGCKQSCACTRTQETGAVSAQETVPGLTVSIQESLAEAWADGGLLKGQGP